MAKPQFRLLMCTLGIVMSLCMPSVYGEEPILSVQELNSLLQRTLAGGKHAIGRGARDARSFILGPSPTLTGFADTRKSCNEIYAEVLNLMPQTYGYAPSYWDDPRNQAGALGTVFTPAYFLWGVSAVSHYRQQRRIAEANERWVALQRMSAEKQCFVR